MKSARARRHLRGGRTLGIGGGTSPQQAPQAGPISNDSATFRFLIAVSQPDPPCEWVTRIPGPILPKSADTASGEDFMSNGPVFGTIARKY